MSDPVSSVDSLIDIDLSHYRIIEEIGSGGMGVVYRARDAHLDREVAIKVLRPGTISDETARKHLRKEAQVLSKLNHPNIATVYDFDIQGAVDFLVMEYIPGITLSAKLVAGPLPEKEVLRLGVQLSDGLAAAHEHGVVHRDLKPGNLRLTRDGRLKILDFGLAKLRPACGESAATVNSFESNSISGTLPYMAPEQLAGEELDIRTDIHGAGFVLYEMATGQRPFAEVQSGQLIGALLRKAPIPPSRLNPYVSAGLERIIEKCVERDPENRYQSAKELAVDLQRLQRDTYMGPSNSEADHRQFPRLLLPGWRLFPVVGACILVLVGVAAQLRREHGQAVSPRENTASIAVLPFVDMSLQHDQEYFSDGLAEELLNHLTKIPNLKIAARASAFRFNGKNEDVRVIGKKLNVANVLEGSIRRDGNRIRVNAQLIRADDGFNLWSDSYDRDLKDVFAVQDDIAAAVTSALQLKLHTSTRSTTLPSPKTTIPETYEAFLHARYFSHLFDKESAAKGLEYANQAIQSDPNYAPAYALRATILLSAGGMLWIDPTEATGRARRDTEKVIALDPYLADGYRVLSTIRAEIESNCPEAERSLQKARELAPGDPDNLGRGAMLAMCQGRQQEAVELLKQELVLDPLRPSEYMNLAQNLRDLGRYDEAHTALAKALDLNPNESMVHEVRGEVYLAQGRPQEALTEMEKEPESWTRDLGKALAYHALGREPESEAALAQLISQHADGGAYQIAEASAYRGEVDQAFDWLNRAYRQHDPGLQWFKTDLKLKSLRQDPRFHQLLRRLNLSD